MDAQTIIQEALDVAMLCEWFKCPECKDTLIMGEQNYCGTCGAKIKWILNENK